MDSASLLEECKSFFVCAMLGEEGGLTRECEAAHGDRMICKTGHVLLSLDLPNADHVALSGCITVVEQGD